MCIHHCTNCCLLYQAAMLAQPDLHQQLMRELMSYGDMSLAAQCVEDYKIPFNALPPALRMHITSSALYRASLNGLGCKGMAHQQNSTAVCVKKVNQSIDEQGLTHNTQQSVIRCSNCKFNLLFAFQAFSQTQAIQKIHCVGG